MPVLNTANILLLLTVALVSAGCSSSSSNDDEILGNCLLIDSTGPLDTDGDGLDDACDNDDDNDGFVDVNDPAPLDGAVPGDFSTPESILNDPLIQQALSEAEAQGIVIPTSTALSPPDISGFFVRDDLAGNFPVNSSGLEDGRPLVGAELRLEQSADNTFSTASVSFTNQQPISFAIGSGSLIRGEGSDYTVYNRSRSICTEAGSNYETLSVSITSASLNSDTGDIENRVGISTTVAVAGELTTACANRLVGDGELEGSWAVSNIPLTRQVQAADLVFMCVDEDFAYAPTETWTSSAGLSCSCTTDFQVLCE